MQRLTPYPDLVELELFKEHLKITHNHEDLLLKHFLRAASQNIEGYLGQIILLARFKVIFAEKKTKHILPYVPVQSIIAIEGKQGFLLEDNCLHFKEASALNITYDAGCYETKAAIPDKIINGIIVAASHNYYNRENPKPLELKELRLL